MQMKQQASAVSGGKTAGVSSAGSLAKRTNPNRLRVHYLKRFQRASEAASKLLKLATGAVDDISLIEIEGYKAQLEAIYNMEKRSYEDALNNLLKSKHIFEQIASYQDTLEALIYGEKVGQLSTFIRSVAQNLSIGNADDIALEDAAKLTQQIQSALEQQPRGGSSSGDTEMKSEDVKINGRSIPLKSIKLRDAFASLNKHEQEIEQLMMPASPEAEAQNATKLIQLQLSLVNMLDEMVQLITKEKKEEQMRSEVSGQLYNTLLAHLQLKKLTYSKQRNLMQAETLAKQLDLDLILGSGFGSKKDKLTREQKP